jgi:hypothetical protein
VLSKNSGTSDYLLLDIEGEIDYKKAKKDGWYDLYLYQAVQNVKQELDFPLLPKEPPFGKVHPL